MIDWIINGIRGLCMALADSVPGVSGGTIAFILGFYDKFVNSLNDLMFGKKQDRKKALTFLVKLGMGWVVGMVLAVLILTNLFEAHIYEVSSLFLGFVLFSIPLIAHEEVKNLKGKYGNLFFTLIGMAVVVLITYFNPISGAEAAVNIADLNIGMALYILLAGMIAISAMVLPGISGSTLLLIFGLYMPIMTAVKQILHFEFASLPAVIIFGIGIVLGIIVTIKLVKAALTYYRSQSIYCILGLMLGSLYAIVMGPTTLEAGGAPLAWETFNIWYFVVGGVIILGLELIKQKIMRQHDEKAITEITDIKDSELKDNKE